MPDALPMIPPLPFGREEGWGEGSVSAPVAKCAMTPGPPQTNPLHDPGPTLLTPAAVRRTLIARFFG